MSTADNLLSMAYCSIAVLAIYGGIFVTAYGIGWVISWVIRAILIRANGRPYPLSWSNSIAMGLVVEGIASAILFERSDEALLDILVVSLLTLFLLLLGGLLWAFWGGFESPESGPRLKSGGTVWIALVFAIGLFWFVGECMREWKLTAARSYGDRAVPLLEEIKHAEGAYPRKLPTSEMGHPPTLLTYWSDGTTFKLSYKDPGYPSQVRFEITSSEHNWTSITH